MDGIAFSIGALDIYWYGILTLIGTVSSFAFIYYRWRKIDYSKYHFWLMTTFTLLIALFGARWWYLIFHPQDFTGIIDLFLIGSGRSIQGAVFFGGAFMFIYTTWIAPHLSFRKVGSIVFPHILLGQAIGRWGNFFNQEVYGLEVAAEQLQWLPEYIRQGMLIEGADGVLAYRQPLFLYESVANFIGWILIAFVAWNIKWFKPGTMISLYAIWYNSTRLIMELYRDPEFIMNINGVPTSFIMTALFLLYGVVSFIIYQFYFERIATFGEFFLRKRFQLIKSQYKIVFAKIMRRYDSEQYKTLMIVVKKRYNKYLNAISKEKIERYKKEIMTWDK